MVFWIIDSKFHTVSPRATSQVNTHKFSPMINLWCPILSSLTERDLMSCSVQDKHVENDVKCFLGRPPACFGHPVQSQNTLWSHQWKSSPAIDLVRTWQRFRDEVSAGRELPHDLVVVLVCVQPAFAGELVLVLCQGLHQSCLMGNAQRCTVRKQINTLNHLLIIFKTNFTWSLEIIHFFICSLCWDANQRKGFFSRARCGIWTVFPSQAAQPAIMQKKIKA